MTGNIVINEKRMTLEVTKKFLNESRIFGSEAYEELKSAKKDFPRFKVVTKKVKTVDRNKGLTYKAMEKYIAAKNDKELMDEFRTLRGTSAEALEVGADSVKYDEIKTWFQKKFPEIAEFQKKREELIAG